MTMIRCILAVALSSAARGTQENVDAGSLIRGAYGAPICGLGRDFHAGRRAALRAELGAGVLVCRGLPEPRAYSRFHQDKVFWYVTGVETPNAALVMDLESEREVLFLPNVSALQERWAGELWDARDDWVGPLTGFEEVRPADELMDVLSELIEQRQVLWISKHPPVSLGDGYDRAGPYDLHRASDPLDGRPSSADAFEARLREHFARAKIQDFRSTLNGLRRVKASAEIAAMERAAQAGARALVEAMRSSASGVGEWEIEALLGLEYALEGASGPAFNAIVASGPNAGVLHYSANARRMQAGELVLIDCGPELDHYTSNLARTWPVDGQFTRPQAEIYDKVLAAQNAGIAAVAPGATLADVELAVVEKLREQGLSQLKRHGVCHLIGMEIHDGGRRSGPLEPGVVFTIEPSVTDKVTGLSVRLADVVVVTPAGCRVLTDGAPRERSVIEAAMAAKGRLEPR